MSAVLPSPDGRPVRAARARKARLAAARAKVPVVRELDITPRPKMPPPRRHPRPAFNLRRPRPVPTAEPDQAG